MLHTYIVFALTLVFIACGDLAAATTTTVTLLDVFRTEHHPPGPTTFFPSSFSISEVVGSDGFTTYIEEIVESERLEQVAVSTEGTTDGAGSLHITGTSYSTSTSTFSPQTVHATRIQDASSMEFIEIESFIAYPKETVKCHWSDNSIAVCTKVEALIEDPTTTQLYTTVFTGTVAPLFTLVEDDSGTHVTSTSAPISNTAQKFAISLSTFIFITSMTFVTFVGYY